MVLLGRQLTFLPTFHAPTLTSQKTLSNNELRDHIKTAIGDFKGDYSVYYEDLVTGGAFGIDHNTVLTAASLNKVPVVFYLYSLASERKINLEEKIVLQESDIQDYGTGVLRYREPGEAYTLKRLAELSFHHSDNTAIHLLTIRLGEDNIQSFVDNLGMGATSIAYNETSPRDMGNLFSQFYMGKLMSEPLKRELMDYLSNTEFEDRIPRYLEEDVVVYHKTGDHDNMVHDGGVVDDGKNPFVLIVMSQGIIDEDNARDTIGVIAKEIIEKR